MSTETERITNEVLNRNGLGSWAKSLVAESNPQTMENNLQAAIDFHFTNKAYMELESPARNTLPQHHPSPNTLH
ncbi:MAG: hypothetical protein ABR956_18600 [Terracidiphilus sp.]|jgi:hypothetical protein